MALKGSRELNARMKALRLAFKPIGKKWATETVELAKPHVPIRTGKTRQSLRVRNATQRKATVVGSHVAHILDVGAGPHVIKAKGAGPLIFEVGGRTIFARQVHHRGVRGSGYANRAANEALRKNPMAETLIKEWNGAA